MLLLSAHRIEHAARARHLDAAAVGDIEHADILLFGDLTHPHRERRLDSGVDDDDGPGLSPRQGAVRTQQRLFCLQLVPQRHRDDVGLLGDFFG